MSIRTLGRTVAVILAAALVLTARRAWALGEILGETKEQFKLEYELAVHDHGTGRVTAVLTIADEGRLKPLSAVELMVPKEDGDGYVDLSVSLATTEEGGKRVARVHLKKEWAGRAEIWLTTSTLDGKQTALTRYHHVIPIAKGMKDAPAAAQAPPSDPATGQRKK